MDVCSARGQAGDDADDHLAQDDDREQVEPLDHGVAGPDPEPEHPRARTEQLHGHEPPADVGAPHDEAWIGRQDRAHDDHHDRHRHEQQVRAGDGQEFRAVTAPDGQPEPGRHREEGGVGQRERRAGITSGVGGEHGEEGEDRHLHEHEQPGPPVLTTVHLDVQRAVDPRGPDHPEQDRELDDAAGIQTCRQRVTMPAR